jgi:sulfite reductase (ferredoxin)
VSTIGWRDRLEGQMPPDLAEEIDVFENQVELRKDGRVDERVFAETRLRRGVYGQRYDNGMRHDGVEQRRLEFPSGDLTKGPETLWDAPGMLRIKVPWGGLTPLQIDVMAELAEEYSDHILHITTRQDVQLHYVHIEDMPTVMRRLAAVGMTTREACGNGVRNLTACPLAGVCRTESFDVTPHSEALFRFLLGHPDCQDFGRKFKIAFSGCADEACGLVMLHDLGAVARTDIVDGVPVDSFDVYVGGGLGTTPHQAKLLAERVPPGELLPVVQAVSRVFARLGEKQNRNRARIKFLVAQVGIEEFQRLVREEREILPYDPRWTAHLEDGLPPEEPARALDNAAGDDDASPEFRAWRDTNVYPQRQPGYAVVTIPLPLGDIASAQARLLADVARRFVGDTVRTTVEQNIVFRWVRVEDLSDLHAALAGIGMADPVAETIVDVTSCPGTDTCKLGISASRGLAGELRERLAAQSHELDEAVKGLRIKVSGCFNSCGQHHVADIGFFGNSRKSSGRVVPHFQVVLGGQWQHNAGSYGLAVGAIPSKRIPEVVDRITGQFVADRLPGESFLDWTGRTGRKGLAAIIEDLKKVPEYEHDPGLFSDWGNPREFSIGDIGIGECAGEVISSADLELSFAESIAFEAQVALEDGDVARADERAYRSMVTAARALVRTELPDVPEDDDVIVREFDGRFVETGRFRDRFAHAKFARPLLDRHASGEAAANEEAARSLVEEAQLFIDAAHQFQIREAGATSATQ